MKLTVYKYSLLVKDRQVLHMPLKAQLLTVQIQHGQLNLWVLVDSETEDREDRVILMKGTGHIVEKDSNLILRYISTVQDLGGTLVWHFFEEVQMD